MLPVDAAPDAPRPPAIWFSDMDHGSKPTFHDVLKDILYALTGLSEMGTKEIKAAKCAVLFPDELDIVDVVGEKFHADNWFKYMSKRLKEKHSISESLKKMRDSNILEKKK
jgi:hypothetical protein